MTGKSLMESPITSNRVNIIVLSSSVFIIKNKKISHGGNK